MSGPRVAESCVEEPAPDGVRLDVFISDHMRLFSRSQAKSRIVQASVDGRPAKLSRRLRHGETVSVTFTDPPPVGLEPERIPLAVIYENADVVVVDKPAGMVVHPGSGNRSGTLVNALLARCGELGEAFGGDNPRPGIVHRLDKDTSGVIVVAKNPRAHEALASQFAARSVKKVYVAVVRGTLPAASGRIETSLARDPRNRKRFTCVRAGGKPALTFYRVLRSYEGYALVALRPRTGRTHQLRVHMRYLRSPILGDPLYGRADGRFPDAGLMLHARSLEIVLPGETAARKFTAAIPPAMRETLKRIQILSAK